MSITIRVQEAYRYGAYTILVWCGNERMHLDLDSRIEDTLSFRVFQYILREEIKTNARNVEGKVQAVKQAISEMEIGQIAWESMLIQRQADKEAKANQPMPHEKSCDCDICYW